MNKPDNIIAAISAFIAAVAILVGVATAIKDRSDAAKLLQTASGIDAFARFSEMELPNQKLLVKLLESEESIPFRFRTRLQKELAEIERQNEALEKISDKAATDPDVDKVWLNLADRLASDDRTVRYQARRDLTSYLENCGNETCSTDVESLLPDEVNLLASGYRLTIGILVGLARMDSKKFQASDDTRAELKKKLEALQENHPDNTMKSRAADALKALAL